MSICACVPLHACPLCLHSHTQSDISTHIIITTHLLVHALYGECLICYACMHTLTHSITDNKQNNTNTHTHTHTHTHTPFKAIRFRCHVKKCHNKARVQFVCPDCHHNHCIAHRHRNAHNCKYVAPTNISSGTSGMKLLRRLRDRFLANIPITVKS